MFGILNINKPIGDSSRDIVTRVVQLIRRADGSDKPRKKIKAGHAGTLDPQASGVLIVCLGKATRLIPYIQRSLKVYRGRFQLDVTSDSADTESAVTPIENQIQPSLETIKQAIPDFTGKIQQKPPAFSAISIDGQRAYRLARKGIEFEIKSKEVFVQRLEILSFNYPYLELLIECGTGTYIRSLGRDLARSIGSDAVMTDLVRTSIGNFSLETAVDGSSLEYQSIVDSLINPLEALPDLPRLSLTEGQIEKLANGRFLDPPELEMSAGGIPTELAALDSRGNLVAVVEPIDGQVKAKINLL